jgi:regulator of replication initiation timing
MAKMATATAARGGVDLDPIDRLEEKVKMLVNMVERMKADQARAVDENQRLTREIESLRGRLASNDNVAAELSTLKQERDVIRSRVGEMLEQLEALNLN